MQSQTFVAQAETGKNIHWIWYVLGVCFIFFMYFIGQFPILWVVQSRIHAGTITETEAVAFGRTLDFTSIGITSAVGLLLILCSFVTALIGLYLYVKFVHGRKLRSLVSSGSMEWGKVFFAAIIWFILTALAEVVFYFAAPDAYHITLQWEKWIPLILISVFIIPLQTSFEELLVRGYLLQRIALAARRPWISIGITALLFGGMHVNNPEIKEFGLGIMMVYYVSVGLFLAVMTILDDGLEYALGIHAATNIYGAGFVTYKGSALQTDALIKVDMINPAWMVVLFFVSVILFYVLVKYKYGIQDFRVVFRPMRQQIASGESVVID